MAGMFAYRAKDRTGQYINGVLIAENESAVAAYIRSQGQYPIKIHRQRQGLRAGLTPPVAAHDLAIFCRQFATMLDAGLSMLICLKILAEQTYNPSLRAAVKELLASVQAGETLAGSMERHLRIFPGIMINMIRAGEMGGVLDEVLNRLALHYEKEHKLNAKIKSALTYPALVLFIAFLSVGFIFIFVLPSFVQMFEHMETELPPLTRTLLAVSVYLSANWELSAGLLFAGVLLSFYAAQFPAVKVRVAQMGSKLPVFGMLAQKIAIARFSRTLGTLLRGGVPILTALETVKATLDNTVMLSALSQAQGSVKAGQGLAQPLGASRMFPAMVVQMVAVGEETGELDKMLEKVADFYESDVEDMTERLSSLLEPLLIGILGIILGAIILSVALPMFDMVTNIQRLQ